MSGRSIFVIWRLVLLALCFNVSAIIEAEENETARFSLGDAILLVSEQGKALLTFPDGKEIAPETAGFRLRFEDGTFVESVKFQKDGVEPNSYRVTYENGAVAKYRIESGNGFILFNLEEIESEDPVSECYLFNVSVPNLPVVGWINSVTLDTGLRIGVMTTSINVLPYVNVSKSIAHDKAGCSHSFKKVVPNDVSNEEKDSSNIVEFSATSTLETNEGWSLHGAEWKTGRDMRGCVKLRARVYGDGNGEALKIQLGGAKGNRDDYIEVDFEGWKICELDAPALNDLSYDDVRRLCFYYNGLPAKKSVRCLIDWVEAVYKNDDGSERIELLEDFSSFRELYGNETTKILNAKSVARHRVFPASCALVAANTEHWKKTVQNMQERAGVPSPRLMGEWRGDSPYLHQSYFFLTSFSAEEYESALKFIKRGGFKQVLLLQNSWTSSTGHYRVNERTFPGGVAQLKEVIQKFNNEGIRFGLHFLGASVDSFDPYMTPIPDKRFVTDVQTELVKDLPADASSSVILTDDNVSSFPIGEDPYMGSGQVLRVDDELIEYSRIEKDGFYDCKRGLYGTKISEHKKGATVYHFTRAYGYHLPNLDTDFIDEIASNFAELANQLPLDMIYFDGSELLQRPGEGSEHWYYNARLHKAFYDKLNNKNILVQASSCSPYSWHMIARNASADGHDDLKAYLEERSGGFDPDHTAQSYLDVGWYYAYDHNSTPDMYEYCLGATIGYDASFSFQTAVAAAKSHPFIGDILDTIRKYEELRLSHRFPDDFRKNFRIDGALQGKKTVEERNALFSLRKEYCLETDKTGAQFFRRVFYPSWENVGAGKNELGGTTSNNAIKDGDSYCWNLKVDVPCRLGLQVHFKEEGETQDDASFVDPTLRVFKLDGDKLEEVGKIDLTAQISRGQYFFSLPGKNTAVYGLPLQEPAVSSTSAPELRLDSGEYRIEFSAKSGLDLPIRVRTPLYSDDVLQIPD